MDTVPWLFIESVCLCLLDRESLSESRWIRSRWGEICSETAKKIYTLRVFLDGTAEKIYATTEPAMKYNAFSTYYNASSTYVPLDSVDLKFITNFRIETRYSPEIYKEITLDDLQRLVHFIRPTRNERHPLSYDSESLNTLTLGRESAWINGKLLSMRLPKLVHFIRPVENERHPLRYDDKSLNTLSLWRESEWINGKLLSTTARVRLPVDSVDLWIPEAEEFFETAGSLYQVRCEGPLKQSTIDALSKKFVPIDDGSIYIYSVSNKQLKKLFEKCANENGEICSVTCKKIHTLHVDLIGSSEKIFAAAQPLLYDGDVSLDSIDPKFITNFQIITSGLQKLPRIWKEITLDELQRLVRLIRPTKNERHPLRYHFYSANTLRLESGSKWINGKLLSMELPMDYVFLWYVEAQEFFETAGPLYFVRYTEPTLKPSTMDTLIDKFIPLDKGSFQVGQRLSEKQLKKLFEKCAMSKKKVRVSVPFDATVVVDYDKYYSKKEVRDKGKVVVFSNDNEAKLELRMSRSSGYVGGPGWWLEWDWCHRGPPAWL
uniref:F-box domain-containing protein n=1 Tax=Steinernema glaseri TaxID=37863 RepID=A0A1I7YLI9_9BILA